MTMHLEKITTLPCEIRTMIEIILGRLKMQVIKIQDMKMREMKVEVDHALAQWRSGLYRQR